ncbi:MAG: hypothetical protein JEZ14_09445 [Marinilabiliaceae bacterium]|nr:hypothetical protein [Marinilabiliaceae bacterium]
MNSILIALLIGIIAGLIDVIPMMIQKLDKFACWSAFIHWVVLGLIIPFVNWDMAPWLKGIVIAELTAIPVLIIVFPKDNKAVLPIVVFSVFLGAGVGAAGALFIG